MQEGVLGPGDLLYIPPGAPHAAETLDDSLMFASNDGSFKSMDLLRKVCRASRSRRLQKYCRDEYHEDAHKQMLTNARQHNKTVQRETKPLLGAYRCDEGRYCESLMEEMMDPEDRFGHAIIMKYCQRDHRRGSTEL